MAVKKLSATDLGALLEGCDNFLFDCDGVLWHGNHVIPGATDALSILKSLGKRVFYVTNNSTSTRAQYAAKCRKLGLPAEEADIVCTAHSIAALLSELLKPKPDYRPKVYTVGNEAMKEELFLVGIDCIGISPDPVPDEFTQDMFRIVELEQDIKAVVVGFDKHLSFLKILKAASYLKDPDMPFIATNLDSNFPVASSRITIPGTGCVVAPVAMAANRQPVVVGKPESLMFDTLSHEFGLQPSRSIFIGDRLDTDILLARRCGLKSILTLTGVSTLAEAVENHDLRKDDLVPDFYIDSMDVLHGLLMSLRQGT